MANYVTASDLSARMSAEDYARLFDRDGTGTVDSAFVTTCLNTAESMVEMKLNAGGWISLPLNADSATVDEAIKDAICRVAMYVASRSHPSDGIGQGKTPYRQGYDDAMEFITAITKDMARARTASGGARATPHAAANGTTNTDQNEGGPFGRAADGKDWSGF